MDFCEELGLNAFVHQLFNEEKDKIDLYHLHAKKDPREYSKLKA